MNQLFVSDIGNALETIHYNGESDNKKLRSAVLDLSSESSDEKKLFSRNADDQFLKICCAAADGFEEPDIVKQKAAKYLHNEYKIEEGTAYEMAEMVVTAFVEYGNQNETATSAENKNAIVPLTENAKGKERTTTEKENEYTFIKENNSCKENKNKEQKLFFRKPVIFIIVGIIIAVLCASPIIYRYFYPAVPSLIKSDEKTAKTVLKDEGLKYKEKDREFSTNVTRGCVISQSINKGTKVKRGTTVSVIVSRGEAITVPDLRGKRLTKATKIAGDEKLVVEVESTKYSDTVKRGRVISQTPKPGEKCEQGDIISVVKSRGIEQIKVPDMVGETQEKAEKTLEKKKLKCSVTTEYSGSVEYGKVIRQSEEAGSRINKNSTVVIYVSAGTAPVVRSSSGSNRSSSGGSKKKTKKSGGGSGDGDWTMYY